MWAGGPETRNGPQKGGKEVLRKGVGKVIECMRHGSGEGILPWKGKAESGEMRGRSRKRGSSQVCMAML